MVTFFYSLLLHTFKHLCCGFSPKCSTHHRSSCRWSAAARRGHRRCPAAWCAALWPAVPHRGAWAAPFLINVEILYVVFCTHTHRQTANQPDKQTDSQAGTTHTHNINSNNECREKCSVWWCGGVKFIRQPQNCKKVNKQTKDKNERNVFTQKFITVFSYIHI